MIKNVFILALIVAAFIAGLSGGRLDFLNAPIYEFTIEHIVLIMIFYSMLFHED
jgi:hypothetical protein